MSRIQIQHCFRREELGGGGGGGGEGLCVKSFLPACRGKKIGTSFHIGWLAKFGWILTYLKIQH